jgi:hypothetical protein
VCGVLHHHDGCGSDDAGERGIHKTTTTQVEKKKKGKQPKIVDKK